MADGEFYESFQGEINPFQVLCLPVDDYELTATGLGHHKRRVIRHVFERANSTARTHGPRVPKWSHVNNAFDQLLGDPGLAVSRMRWSGMSPIWSWTWNPMAEPGSQAALTPTYHTDRKLHAAG